MTIKAAKRILLMAAAIVTALAIYTCVSLISDSGQAFADTYKYKVKTKDALTVRSKATTSSSKLGTLKKGKIVYPTLLTGSNKWYKIKYNGKTGYIYKKYTKYYYKSTTYTTKKTGKTKSSLNVRKGASTKYGKLGSLAKGKKVTLYGSYNTTANGTWYRIKYSGKTGYISSTYVSIVTSSSSKSSSSSSSTSSSDFEAYMTAQGFPESYKPYLRKLHKAHPKWKFVAQKTGYSWSSMFTKKKALKPGTNLIDKTVSSKWRSTDSDVYNKKTKKWTTFDGGRWYQAKTSVIKYYMDPRNFLNETSIYQFMGHQFDSSSQTTSTIKSIVKTNSKCFMNTTSYINNLYKAGKGSGVNPNVITAMVIMEQGWKGGSGLISGKYKGYKGYYNHFNIGAYTTSTMSATERGLWYAKGCNKGYTSYGRPWNSIVKSLKGGALFYKAKYINNKQYTYYTKKFNVMNGLSKVATHEYMTNVQGAESEGKILKYAYKSNSNYPITFYIPVYNNMPSSVCKKPAQ